VSEQYPEHILLDSQWKAVYEHIEAASFNPSEFARSETYGRVYNGMVPNLIHKRSGSEFVFDFDRQDGTHHAEWSPASDKPRDRDQAGVGEGFAYILHLLGLWLEVVRRELTTPDLWAMLDQQRELLAATEPTGETANTPFSPEEQRQIAAQLDDIKQLLVNNYGADPKALERGIEDLEELARRSGRREWLLLFLGGVFHWTLTGLVPPEGLQIALKLAEQGIGHLFGGGVPQLPMP